MIDTNAYTAEYSRWRSVQKVFSYVWMFLRLDLKDVPAGLPLVWKYIKDEIEIMSLREQLRRMDQALGEVLRERNQLVEKISAGEYDPIYCPVCGSCGEEGCCGIDCCKEVKGLYCDSNKQTYKAMERQWNIMWEALQKIYREGWGGSLDIAVKAIEDVEDDMKLEAYYDWEAGKEE